MPKPLVHTYAYLTSICIHTYKQQQRSAPLSHEQLVHTYVYLTSICIHTYKRQQRSAPLSHEQLVHTYAYLTSIYIHISDNNEARLYHMNTSSAAFVLSGSSPFAALPSFLEGEPTAAGLPRVLITSPATHTHTHTHTHIIRTYIHTYIHDD